MTVAERLSGWNRWYDGLPQEWRFQLILWPLIALGACNMLLSLSMRFPFGLLVLLGVLFVAAVRVPYILGWITPARALPSGGHSAPRLEIGGAGADWIAGLNGRYEALPEKSRFWIFPAILVVAGAINMQLTIHHGYPFGLLFLIALLAIIVVRAPYVHGLIQIPSAAGVPAPALQYNARITDERAPTPADADADTAALIPPMAQSAQHEPPVADLEEAPQASADGLPAAGPDRDDNGLIPASPAASPRWEPDDADAAHPPSPPRQHSTGSQAE